MRSRILTPLLLSLGALFFAAVVPPSLAASTTPKQKILVKLGHYTDDLHSAFMAAKLAEMLQGEEAEVTIFLNLEAVRIADKRHPIDMRWGMSEPLSQHLDNFLAAGGKIVVCPHCAKVAGIDEKNLRKGMKIGDHKDLKEMILRADKILDY